MHQKLLKLPTHKAIKRAGIMPGIWALSTRSITKLKNGNLLPVYPGLEFRIGFMGLVSRFICRQIAQIYEVVERVANRVVSSAFTHLAARYFPRLCPWNENFKQMSRDDLWLWQRPNRVFSADIFLFCGRITFPVNIRVLRSLVGKTAHSMEKL